MTSKETDEDGNLKRVVENGEEVLNTEQLRQKIDQINGNPKMIEGLKEIIDYIEKSEKV